MRDHSDWVTKRCEGSKELSCATDPLDVPICCASPPAQRIQETSRSNSTCSSSSEATRSTRTTWPPGEVTLAISSSINIGSVKWWTASLDTTSPKLESGNGRAAALPCVNLMLERCSSSAFDLASISIASVASRATTSLERGWDIMKVSTHVQSGARVLANMPVPDATSNALVWGLTLPRLLSTQSMISLLLRFIRWFHWFSNTGACFVNSFWITEILSLDARLLSWLFCQEDILKKICRSIAVFRTRAIVTSVQLQTSFHSQLYVNLHSTVSLRRAESEWKITLGPAGLPICLICGFNLIAHHSFIHSFIALCFSAHNSVQAKGCSLDKILSFSPNWQIEKLFSTNISWFIWKMSSTFICIFINMNLIQGFKDFGIVHKCNTFMHNPSWSISVYT